MSTILLQINFNNKEEVTRIVLDDICKDIYATIFNSNKKYFMKKENIYMNYSINTKFNQKLIQQ